MDQPSAAEAATDVALSAPTQQVKGNVEGVLLSAAAADAPSLPFGVLDPNLPFTVSPSQAGRPQTPPAESGPALSQFQSQPTLLSSTEAVSFSPPALSSHACHRPRLEAHEQVLRLRASEIAAVAGFHPFKDLLELLDGHIYQDLPQLQEEDCAVCGVVLVSKEQEFEHLAQQAGPQAAAALRKIQAGSRSATVQTTGDVDKVKMDIGKALKLAAVGGRVAEADITVLRNHLTNTLSTEFGKRHEDSAIELYESRHGVRVHSQNDKMLTWCFPQDPGGVSLDTPPPLEIKSLRERREVCEAAAATAGGGGRGGGGGWGSGAGAGAEPRSRKKDEVEYGVVAVGDEDASVKVQPSPQAMSSSNSSLFSSSSEQQQQQRQQHDHHPRSPSRTAIRGPDAWFRVCGVVDGLTESLDASHDDPSAWQMRTTVVEVREKNDSRLIEYWDDLRQITNPPRSTGDFILLAHLLSLSYMHR